MRKVSSFIILILVTISSFKSFCQPYNIKNRYTSIGVSAGAMNYIGELDPNPNLLSPAMKYTRYNIGVSLARRFFPRVSVRGNVSYGRIMGDDYENANYDEQKNIHRKIRNLSFRSYIFEGKGDVVIDLFQNRGNFRKRVDFTPYGFVGLAFFRFNPKTEFKGTWVDLQPLQTEGKKYSLNQFAVPFGIGFRYRLNKVLDLAFEIGWRYTMTDYLDDVSNVYVNKNPGEPGYSLADRSREAYAKDPKLKEFIDNKQGGVIRDGSGNIVSVNGYGQNGDKRGDGNRDWYVVTGFHLTYILPGRIICPKFR